MTNRWWQVYLGGGALTLALYAVLSPEPLLAALYMLVGLSCVVAIVAGVRLHSPRQKLPWLLMALGQLLWVSADSLYSWYETVQQIDPFPSPADGLYLVAYPVLAAGLAVLIHQRRRGPDAAGFIDSTIVSVSLGLLSWILVVDPLVNGTSGPLIERLIGVAYPVGDIVLLAVLVRFITAAGARTTAFGLLAAAAMLLIGVDTVYAATGHLDQYSKVMDLCWLSSYLLWGAAALHPSMARLADPGGQAQRPFTRRRLVALTVAVLVAPSTLAAQLTFGRQPDTWAVIICSMILSLLVVARMGLAIRAAVATASQRDRLQSVLSHESAHDPLTGLANRASVLAQIEGALYRGQHAGTRTALLVINLDRFKNVNDTFGHGVGDAVLAEMARRMLATVPEGATVGRLNGDEFVVLLELVGSEREAVDLADRILATLCAEMIVDGVAVTGGASIGISHGREATDARQLLREADVANNRAKAAGRGQSQVFGEALRAEVAEQAALESALVDALELGEFALHYQPVAAVGTEVVEGYEALIRWDRPGLGIQSPDTFVPLAERSDLILQIDRWVLREATHQLCRWTTEDPERYADLTVAVNISGRHVTDAGIVADVTHALVSSGLPPSRLVLEITESVLVDAPTASTHLTTLRQMGVTISLDDFGTGYTSIGQLQRLPVDVLKIDKQFVTSTASGARDLMKLMVSAAHSSGLSVVAEGVETTDQLEALRSLDVDAAQGFLFGCPQSADAVQGRLGVGRG